MKPSSSSARQEALASYRRRPGPLLLRSEVQRYAWGDTHFIPELLGIDNTEKGPFAELWMGAHSDLPSRARIDDAEFGLDELLELAGEEILGPEVLRRFGGLPFLLKILAAAAPLSIQVHPKPERAKQGFARENRAGVPLWDGKRNYKDENHKPELLVALTDFYGLRGFRPLPDIQQTLREVPELRRLMPDFEPSPDCLESLYERLMNLPQEEVDAVLDPLVRRLGQENREGPFHRMDIQYWILRADQEFSRGGHRDRGLLSIYLLNLVHLKPGKAMFLPAGVLHAYLEGAGVEIMANSNNVLRGGLTTKHVDVPELLANVDFVGGSAEIFEGEAVSGTGEWIYRTPTEEFELSRVELTPSQPLRRGPLHGAEIVMLIGSRGDPEIAVATDNQTLRLRKGQACLIPRGLTYTVRTSLESTLYRASVPKVADVGSITLPTPSFRGRNPNPLQFGTSGLRGLVTDMTDLEVYINTRGFLDYLFRVGDARIGDTVSIAGDLRPSTDGENWSIMRAAARAIQDAGLRVDHLGRIPTPALTYFALRNGRSSVMVTGSHIPFDRNGIKFNRRSGEVLKEDEPGILEAVAQVREREYHRPSVESLFGDDGMFRPGVRPALGPVNQEARQAYLRRYLDFFPPRSLTGRRIVLFQHSAVGRDVLLELMRTLGAEVHPAGRSDEFVAIDTENITEDRLRELQGMVDEIVHRHGPVDALISTDGDGDRPLLVGVDSKGRARFYGGDLLGIVVAEYLGADCISVPISVNDAVDRQLSRRGITLTKTAIGSPYVIRSMQQCLSAGMGSIAIGWEANGGFLTGSKIAREGRRLEALPTRDAVLPLIAVLRASVENDCSVVELFGRLPPRFSSAGLLDRFSQEAGRALVGRFSWPDVQFPEVEFEGDAVTFHGHGRTVPAPMSTAEKLRAIRRELMSCFGSQGGFGEIVRLNEIDGLRIYFANGDIAHIRPSGNAPQLRVYAVADTQERADAIVRMGIQEPDGLLRRLEGRVGKDA